MVNKTQYWSGSNLLLVNASSYDENDDYYNYEAQRLQDLLPGAYCVVSKFSLAAAKAYPSAILLKMLCEGVAGIGIHGWTLAATGPYPQSECVNWKLPPKSSIRKFKASPSAKAACGKIKGVLGNIAQGSAPAKMQGLVNPMASTPGMDTMDTLKPAAAKAKKSSPFAPLNCSVSWATAFNLADKVGGLGGFKVTNHACVWGAAGATAPIPA